MWDLSWIPLCCVPHISPPQPTQTHLKWWEVGWMTGGDTLQSYTYRQVRLPHVDCIHRHPCLNYNIAQACIYLRRICSACTYMHEFYVYVTYIYLLHTRCIYMYVPCEYFTQYTSVTHIYFKHLCMYVIYKLQAYIYMSLLHIMLCDM